MKLGLVLCVIFLARCGLACAQQIPSDRTPLATLLAEAEANNSEIAVARDSWKASTHVAQQVTVLPDPQFTIQSFSVGSPKPFAGFSNSDFAYLGFGATQELPYAGKLKLKGEVANREANAQEANTVVVRSSVAEQVKLLYLRLAYLDATLAVLDRTDAVLRPLIQDALSRYSLGQGNQAGVIKAQLEHTKILREVTMHHEEVGQLQADLKQLVHRRQDSPDIVPEVLTATSIRLGQQELETLVRDQNPVLLMDARKIETQQARLASAKRESKPDFSAGYMLQLTGDDYRNYYMLTLNMRLPRRSRVAGEIAETTEQENRARHELDSEAQQRYAELQKQYIAVTSSAQLLAEYEQGLIPQAQAIVRSEQAAYEANKEAFAPVLSSLLDVLAIELDYKQALFDHESALARMETLTGASLR